MNLSNSDMASIADMLVSYHMHSFRIRRHEIFNIEFDPPVVHELNNARNRLRNDYSEDNRLAQAFGLHEIVSRSKWEIARLAKEAKETEDARKQYEQAEEHMEQMAAADYLLELLNG